MDQDPYGDPVATFPPVGAIERDNALTRIERRHQRYNDYRWSEAGSEAREVLDYLRGHRSRLPRQLVDDDVWDELVLSAWVYWDERRRERELIRHALARGLSLREVGAFVGLHTGQGLRDYLDSLDARLHEYHQLTREPRRHRPDPGGAELLTDAAPTSEDAVDIPADISADDDQPRASRNPYLRFKGRPRADRGADGRYMRSRRASARAKPARATWIQQHYQRIQGVVDDLVREAGRLGYHAVESDDDQLAGVGDYLTWILDDLATNDVDDGTFAALGLALGVLRTEETVTDKAGNHGIHQAISAADRLRADYGALSPDRVA